jgi:hypothetical protein
MSLRTAGLLLTSSIALVAAAEPAAAWDWLWAHQFNSTGFLGAYGGSADASGTYVSGGVSGELPGTTTIGGTDAYVRKIDRSGTVLWTRRIGTARYDDSQGIAADAEGAYITGATCGAFPGQVQAGGCDAYVARLSPDGELVWATQFGTPALDYPYQYGAIALHASGVYVAGTTGGTFPGATPAGGPNTFLARVDRATGALVWVRQFGAPDPGFFNAGGVGVDDTGVAVVANSEAGPSAWTTEVRKYALGGTVQWSRVFDESAAPCGYPVFGLTSHGGQVYVIGQTYEWRLTACEPQPYGQSYVIGLLQRLDGAGQTVWQRRIKAGLPGREGGAGIAPFTGAKVVHVTDAGVFVAANVRKLRFAGDVRREPHRDRSVCGDPAAVENAVWKGFDGYVRRYDHEGSVVWTHQFGSSLYELVAGLGSDGTRVYAAGLTRCLVEEGADPESGAAVDAFAAGFAIEPTTPSGRVQLVVGQVETLSDAGQIASGDFNALITHLESALAALDRSNEDVARASLRAFVSLVENHQAGGRVPGDAAVALIGAANAIADGL